MVLFPRLPRGKQRQRMNVLMVVLPAIVAGGGIVVRETLI
jgi:hypothetical protein